MTAGSCASTKACSPCPVCSRSACASCAGATRTSSTASVATPKRSPRSCCTRSSGAAPHLSSATHCPRSFKETTVTQSIFARDHYDAVIVGARAAGAATALLLAREGWRVLLCDRAHYGSDTLSTHALMRVGVLQLARFGLLERLAAHGTPAVRRTVFHYSGDARFADGADPGAVDVTIKPRYGVDALYAPRRTVLDRMLVDAAREAGVEVHHRVGLLAAVRDQ